MLLLGTGRAWPIARSQLLRLQWPWQIRQPHSTQQCQEHSYRGRQGVQTAAITREGQPSVQQGIQDPSRHSSGHEGPAGHVALIDASYYCYRYHHAFASHIRRNGPNARLTAGGPDNEDSAIQHMFLRFVLEMILDSLKHQKQEQLAQQGSTDSIGNGSSSDSPFGFPTRVVVVFDSERCPEAVHLRRELYPEYKINRGEVAGEVSTALEELPRVLRQMGINYIGMPNVEADDLIATLATTYSKTSAVTIYSPDKDFKQLLSERVCMVSHISQGTRSHTLESFTEQFRFQPCFFPDFQSLAGDSSDNVSGVTGIGEKTAKTLIQKHSTIENLYTALHTFKTSARVRSLEDTGVRNTVLLKSLFQLQKFVRAPDGSELPELLPYSGECLLDVDAAQLEEVEAYCERYKLKQVFERFNQACSMLQEAPKLK